MILFIPILVLFFILACFQFRYLQLLFHRQGNESALNPADLPGVSVILFVGGCDDTLPKTLTSLLTQDYPEYEIIVVNNGCKNDTEDVLKRFSLQYPNLYHTYVPTNVHYLSRKKLALTLGIKAAHHSLLLFTEPDCAPASGQWIRSMVRLYGENTEIVLGYCIYPFKNSLLQRRIAYENLTEGMSLFASAFSKTFFRGDGRNLSYRKELFFKTQGFRKHLDLLSGEDDLFIHEFANRKNVRVCFNPDGFTSNLSPLNRTAWKQKALRQTILAHYLNGFYSFIFRLESFSLVLFYIVAVAGICAIAIGNWELPAVSVASFLLYYAGKIVLYRKTSLLFRSPSPGYWLPLLDILHLWRQVCLSIVYPFKKKSFYTSRKLSKKP